jgi:hypothetical protein
MSNAGGITISHFKLYYRAITAWYWQKQTGNQWIRIKDPDINPHICSQLVFDKEVQNTQQRKDSLFNKCCWETWIFTYRRLETRSLSFTLYQNQLKMDQRP